MARAWVESIDRPIARKVTPPTRVERFFARIAGKTAPPGRDPAELNNASASTQQIAGSAQELTRTAEELDDLVQRFRLTV